MGLNRKAPISRQPHYAPAKALHTGSEGRARFGPGGGQQGHLGPLPPRKKQPGGVTAKKPHASRAGIDQKTDQKVYAGLYLCHYGFLFLK